MVRHFRNQFDFRNYVIIDAFLDLLKFVFICGKNILNIHVQFYLNVGLLTGSAFP